MNEIRKKGLLLLGKAIAIALTLLFVLNLAFYILLIATEGYIQDYFIWVIWVIPASLIVWFVMDKTVFKDLKIYLFGVERND